MIGSATAPGNPHAAATGEAPDEIRLDAARSALTVVWPDGLRAVLGARMLRDDCQSAGSKRIRLAGLDVPAGAEIRIEAVRPIGSYAVNIAFSDGHERGIYPWSQLRALSLTAPDTTSGHD